MAFFTVPFSQSTVINLVPVYMISVVPGYDILITKLLLIVDVGTWKM